ncbi:MAG: lipopolysaccharide biosynthesis protein [Salinibacter sp.]
MAIGKKIGIYLKSSGTGLLSQVVTKLSAFAAVWLLNRILMKGAYGDYEFALALVSMLLILGSGGLQYVAMYRLSRLDADPETLAGQKLAGALLGWSLLLSAAVALAVGGLAPLVASASGKPELAFWVGALAFLIPIRVALGLYRNWYRARQLVAESLVLGQMGPKAAQVVLLDGAWMVWPTPEGVVTAVLLGEALPLLIWIARAPLTPIPRIDLLSGWDVQYAAKLMLTRGLSKSVKRTDVLMMGALATSGATAGYVVASKVAMLLLAGHQLMNLILTPRVGRFLDQEKKEAVQQEYHQSRVVGLSFAMGGTCVLAIGGPWILSLFGEYAEALPVILILAATYVIQVSFGMCGGYLNIAGYANWTLATTGMVLLLNVVLNAALIPVLGAAGAALAMLASITATNAFTAYLVLRLDGVQTYSRWIAGVVTATTGLLILAAFGPLSHIQAGGALLAVVAAFLWSEAAFIQSLVHACSEALWHVFSERRL